VSSLEVIEHKIDSLIKTMEDHCKKDEQFQTNIKETLDGCDEYPGVRGRLRDLEHTTATIKKVFWTIVTPLLAGFGGFAWFK